VPVITNFIAREVLKIRFFFSLIKVHAISLEQ